MPLATMITQNLQEAECLCGFNIQSKEEMVLAAKKIASFYKGQVIGTSCLDIGGRLIKVENGKKLFVHYLGAEHGAVLEFDKVLLVDKDGAVTVGTPTVEGAKVVCEVVSNDGFGNKGLVKGERILVFKKKRRKGYRRLNGHRQYFTEVLVKEIVA